MLSILIPVYNFNVTDLVHELNNQAVASNIPFEIILLDDASTDEFRKINRNLIHEKNIRYIEEKNNIGRSKIRNKLARLASYPYLLFMDCDSRISSPDFITTYLKYCKEDVVVYGGRIYSKNRPDDSGLLLRWKHGKSREEFTASERTRSPNKSFMTNNFLISLNLFNKIMFNEDMEGYGHEDTLFGYELKKNNIGILHIDNPLVHIGLESNSVFLSKTRESIRNLRIIFNQNGYEKLLVEDVKLLGYYQFFRKTGLDFLARFLFRIAEKLLLRNLTGRHPNLLVFDMFKLGYLCTLN
ncbi:MAG: glycosyltransferase [Bacteroidales bacterium]|nr:glycosyltransferase [Bacteroidales bacterium]